MVPVSIVIITKNEANIIAACIKMARLITDDVVVVDSGSTDGTINIAEAGGCRVYQRNWDGYGANKNKGIVLAKYNWILSMDADEVADKGLIEALHQLDYTNPALVYDIKFKTYFGSRQIRFGSWGRDHHLRLFNRTLVKWADLPVHETLILPRSITKVKLNGRINHFSVSGNIECNQKALYYAKLSAQKYFESGKRASFVKLYISPVFNFIKNYIVYLGFLDGPQGWYIAKMNFKQTWLKYHQLRNLAEEPQSQPTVINKHLAFDY